LVILAHPSKGSFNHAIAQAAVAALKDNHHTVRYHDLYDERFDPALPALEMPKNAVVHPLVRQHCEEIAGAEGIVIVHPNWWGQPPAVMKGWIDRVVRPGVAYEFREGDSGEGVPCGLLKAKTALVFNTSNTAEEREQMVFGDPLETIWKNCIFGLCGVTDVRRRTFSVIVTSTEMQRERWLKEVRGLVEGAFGNSSSHRAAVHTESPVGNKKYRTHRQSLS
jgi:NAD(P)H dehydrogenase (quinone)